MITTYPHTCAHCGTQFQAAERKRSCCSITCARKHSKPPPKPKPEFIEDRKCIVCKRKLSRRMVTRNGRLEPEKRSEYNNHRFCEPPAECLRIHTEDCARTRAELEKLNAEFVEPTDAEKAAIGQRYREACGIEDLVMPDGKRTPEEAALEKHLKDKKIAAARLAVIKKFECLKLTMRVMTETKDPETIDCAGLAAISRTRVLHALLIDYIKLLGWRK